MIAALSLFLSAVMAVTPAPRDVLIAKMILTEVAQDGAVQPSASRADAGQCRRFQVNAFASAADGFRLDEYPLEALFLPSMHASAGETGRTEGVAWLMPARSTGNAFEEIARFDQVSGRTAREDREAALAFLSCIKAGDVLQMVATFSGGSRGTHTLMFTRPYDARNGKLYWADSNFDNRVVGGVKMGVMHAYQCWPVDSMIDWLVTDRGNGATLYRVVETGIVQAGTAE